MKSPHLFRAPLEFAFGGRSKAIWLLAFLGAGALLLASDGPPAGAAAAAPSDPSAGIAALQQQLKDLRGQLPSQSHTMADVAYHFSNLWFAGQAGNWPLAEFYLNETKSHLRWAVRVRPVRPLSTGGELRVGDMLAAIEQSTLKDLTESVRAKDATRFTTTYKTQLASCYSCHVAAEKPYLRLHVPERAPETMLEFDPSKPGFPE
jgi:hypothetical protein